MALVNVSIVVIVLAAVYGLLIGSFVNAWAYRLANGKSIVRQKRSVCPRCGAQIRAYDNIPVLSWVLLRGRCRDCRQRIHWRYPVGETLTAVLFAAVAAHDGLGWMLAPHLVFAAALVLVSEVDLEEHIIPDIVVLPGAVIGLAMMIALQPHRWLELLGAGLGAALFLFVVGWIWERVIHAAAMGMGDVKLALLMGFYLGFGVIPALFLGFVAGAVVGVVQVALKKGSLRTAIPFGPFLAAGAMAALFVGQPLIHWYLRFALHR